MSSTATTSYSDGNGRASDRSGSGGQPFPASTKVYVDGTLPGVRVAMREIALTPTKPSGGGAPTPNAPLTVYDTSGPYTDPATHIDIRAGLAPSRRSWILDRNDVEELAALSSEYGRRRAEDPKLAALRYAHIRAPLRAKPGMNVTQLHYARQGRITPEMEYIAIRENQLREVVLEPSKGNGNGNGLSHGGGTRQHPGQAWGAQIPARIT